MLAGDAANFHALGAAAFAALDSNSRLWRFQKIGKEFDQRFVGAIFQGRRAEPDFQSAFHTPAISSLLARGCTRTEK